VTGFSPETCFSLADALQLQNDFQPVQILQLIEQVGQMVSYVTPYDGDDCSYFKRTFCLLELFGAARAPLVCAIEVFLTSTHERVADITQLNL
jgi:hypothetical protein